MTAFCTVLRRRSGARGRSPGRSADGTRRGFLREFAEAGIHRDTPGPDQGRAASPSGWMWSLRWSAVRTRFVVHFGASPGDHTEQAASPRGGPSSPLWNPWRGGEPDAGGDGRHRAQSGLFTGFSTPGREPPSWSHGHRRSRQSTRVGMRLDPACGDALSEGGRFSSTHAGEDALRRHGERFRWELLRKDAFFEALILPGARSGKKTP
jgi:hypothetical protein